MTLGELLKYIHLSLDSNDDDTWSDDLRRAVYCYGQSGAYYPIRDVEIDLEGNVVLNIQE